MADFGGNQITPQLPQRCLAVRDGGGENILPFRFTSLRNHVEAVSWVMGHVSTNYFYFSVEKVWWNSDLVRRPISR